VGDGWVSYTLTFARLRRSDGFSFDDPFERRHQLSAVTSIDFGAGVRGGVRGLVYTGAPFATTSTPEGLFLQPFAQRPQPFWRIDARVEKRWELGTTTSLAVALQWLNATLNREPEMICVANFSGSPPQCLESLRPLLSAPSVTAEAQW
jgi:hypothetical protein